MKKNGFYNLYTLLGEMGNIGFTVASRNFTSAQCASDKDMIARDPRNFFKHYNKCISIINETLSPGDDVPGVKGHFGNGLK